MKSAIMNLPNCCKPLTTFIGIGVSSALLSLSGCATEPNLADLKAQVQALTDHQTALQKQEQQTLERIETMESQLDEHDFLVGELIKTEEEAGLDTRNLLDKLERTSARLREQIEQTRTSTRQRDQDLSIRVKAIEARMDNLIHQRRSETPQQVHIPKTGTQPKSNHADTVPPPVNHSGGDPKQNSTNQATQFRSAYKSYLNGQYERATVEFQRFVKHYPDAALTPQAYYYLGDSQYIQKQYKEATNTLKHILTTYPENKYVPPALVKLGLVMMETDQASKAQELWDQVIQKFPDSSEASLAKDQLAKAQAAR